MKFSVVNYYVVQSCRYPAESAVVILTESSDVDVDTIKTVDSFTESIDTMFILWG